MSTKQFIDQLIAGENAEAKDTIENVLSAKAFEALDEYKKAMATSIFGTTSETVKEEVELDEEQLDEKDELGDRGGTGSLYWSSKVKRAHDPDDKRTRLEPQNKQTPYRVASAKPEYTKSKIMARKAAGGITGPKGKLPEEVGHDAEQLDEISKGLAARTYHKMANDGNDMKGRTGLAGDQSDRLRARMNKRWGEKAATRAINKADKDAYK